MLLIIRTWFTSYVPPAMVLILGSSRSTDMAEVLTPLVALAVGVMSFFGSVWVAKIQADSRSREEDDVDNEMTDLRKQVEELKQALQKNHPDD